MMGFPKKTFEVAKTFEEESHDLGDINERT